MIRITLPHHLQTLVSCDREVTVSVEGAVTQRTVLDALEARYPMLRGTVREHVSLKRRPRVRFFADGSSTGGRVTLMVGERSYAVDVDWLTGRVRVLQ